MVQEQAVRDLERNCDGDWIIGVIAVIEVVPIAGVVEIHIVGFVPVCPPGFRPWIDDRDPISVVLEARLPTHEDQRKAVDAEEMIAAEVEPEAGVGNPVAAVATALTPALVLALPRAGAGLNKACAHLPLVLRNAAVVDAAVGGAVELHAAMINAAIGRLRPSLPLRRCRTLLLMGLLRGPRLLRLLGRFRLAPVIPLLIVLGIGDGCGCKEQRENRCTDYADSFHMAFLLLSAVGALTRIPFVAGLPS